MKLVVAKKDGKAWKTERKEKQKSFQELLEFAEELSLNFIITSWRMTKFESVEELKQKAKLN